MMVFLWMLSESRVLSRTMELTVRRVCCVMVILIGSALAVRMAGNAPVTRFSCQGRPTGYYADIDTGCQFYHMCDELGRKFSFACPNTTLFQQRMMVCDHWYMVNCSKAESDYSANLLIGQRDKHFVSPDAQASRTPRPDILTVPYTNNYYDGLKQAESKYPYHPDNSLSETETLNQGEQKYTRTQSNPDKYSTKYSNNNNGLNDNFITTSKYTNKFESATQRYGKTTNNNQGNYYPQQTQSNYNQQQIYNGQTTQQQFNTQNSHQSINNQLSQQNINNQFSQQNINNQFSQQNVNNQLSQQNSQNIYNNQNSQGTFNSDQQIINSQQSQQQFSNQATQGNFNPQQPNFNAQTPEFIQLHSRNQNANGQERLPQSQTGQSFTDVDPQRMNIDVRMDPDQKDNTQQFINRFDPSSTAMSRKDIQDINNQLLSTNNNGRGSKQNSNSININGDRKDVLTDRNGDEGLEFMQHGGVKTPSRQLQPPKYEQPILPATTMGPPIYYEWKWAAPAFDLEPPKVDSQVSNRNAIPDELDKADRVPVFSTTPKPLASSTNMEEYKFSTYYVPDYIFPLDTEHPGYAGEKTSFQASPEGYGENPACPHCHPAYLKPGTCEPCIKRNDKVKTSKQKL